MAISETAQKNHDKLFPGHVSTYGGQVAFPGNSMYHATKWGIEGFAESVAQEVAPFGIGVTIVEPGGARTRIPLRKRPGGRTAARVRRHPRAWLPGDARPRQRARTRRPGPDGRCHHRQRRTTASPAAHHLGAQALKTTVGVLKDRIASFEAQAALAASADFPPGE